jgi:hypothetical protein
MKRAIGVAEMLTRSRIHDLGEEHAEVLVVGRRHPSASPPGRRRDRDEFLDRRGLRDLAVKGARGGVGERLHGPSLHSRRGADGEQFWFVTAVWFSERRSRFAAAEPDAPKLGAARGLARTAASTRAVAVAGLAVEVAAAGVEPPAMG